jgi:hypothetical protein
MNGPTNLLGLVVLGYLRKHCRGAARARTMPRIARDLSVLGIECDAGTVRSGRAVRDALAELSAAGFPVGTTCGSPAGAFVCETGRDFAVAYRNLLGRIHPQVRRAKAFKVAARETLNGQRSFDFSEAEERLRELERAPLLAGLPAIPDHLGAGPDPKARGSCGERAADQASESEPAVVAGSK